MILISILFHFTFPPSIQIDPFITKSVNQTGSADILCLLKSPYTDLGSITRDFDSKDQMGEYVFTHLKTYADQSQQHIIRQLSHDQVSYRSFYIVNAIHIPHATRAIIDYLIARPEVDHLEYNSNYTRLKPFEENNQALIPLESRSPQAIEWGILRIKADSLWALGIKGKGAVIGGEDTGVDLVADIKKSYRGSQSDGSVNNNFNWHDAIHKLNPLNRDTTQNPKNNPCGLDTIGPCDDDNHGTHTMGTMAATDMQIGIAPEAKWIACRCMERGWGGLASYIECFQFFLAPTDLKNQNPDPKKAPHVINNSWGCPTEEGCNPNNFGTMEQVVKNLKAAGIFVTVSAGNSGGLGCSSINDIPAVFEASFSVGATTNAKDTIAGFSSLGPVAIDNTLRKKPNISAPGVGVLSTIKGGGFTRLSGTSMSGPHVSGAIALLISAFPQLAGKVDLLENILEQSAEPKIIMSLCGADALNAIPNNVFGYGRLDVYKAYQLARQLSATPTADHNTLRTLKVFPNPSDQVIWFDLGPREVASKIAVFNIQGQSVLQKKVNQSLFYVDITSLPAGMYYYSVESTLHNFYSGKIVVKH